MTALQTPAADAPAAEWGALAVSIPDWRWPWSADPLDRAVRLPGFVREQNHSHRVDDIFEEMPCMISTKLGIVQRADTIPDPDHWAWWGWLITLLGPERIAVSMWVDRITVGQSHLVMDDSALGRACIAAAAANGRWPGGEG